jgi:hypothetical protein
MAFVPQLSPICPPGCLGFGIVVGILMVVCCWPCLVALGGLLGLLVGFGIVVGILMVVCSWPCLVALGGWGEVFIGAVVVAKLAPGPWTLDPGPAR